MRGKTHALCRRCKGWTVTPPTNRIALLAVVGNFVSPAPRGPSVAPGSVGGLGKPGASLPTVVVDVDTGRLQVVSSMSSLRAYFLEAMLVVSVLAIARLSMVQTVTVVHPEGEAHAAEVGKPACRG